MKWHFITWFTGSSLHQPIEQAELETIRSQLHLGKPYRVIADLERLVLYEYASGVIYAWIREDLLA